jgi:hypothetical protein
MVLRHLSSSPWVAIALQCCFSFSSLVTESLIFGWTYDQKIPFSILPDGSSSHECQLESCVQHKGSDGPSFLPPDVCNSIGDLEKGAKDRTNQGP